MKYLVIFIFILMMSLLGATDSNAVDDDKLIMDSGTSISYDGEAKILTLQNSLIDLKITQLTQVRYHIVKDNYLFVWTGIKHWWNSRPFLTIYDENMEIVRKIKKNEAPGLFKLSKRDPDASIGLLYSSEQRIFFHMFVIKGTGTAFHLISINRKSKAIHILDSVEKSFLGEIIRGDPGYKPMLISRYANDQLVFTLHYYMGENIRSYLYSYHSGQKTEILSLDGMLHLGFIKAVDGKILAAGTHLVDQMNDEYVYLYEFDIESGELLGQSKHPCPQGYDVGREFELVGNKLTIHLKEDTKGRNIPDAERHQIPMEIEL